MLRAFELRRAGRVVGTIGEGGGPFVTRARVPSYVVLERARYTSADLRCEHEVMGAIDAATTFDAVLESLTRAGFELAAVAYDQRFTPLARSATGDPAARRR